MARANRETDPAMRQRLLVEIVEAARRGDAPIQAFDKVYAWLRDQPQSEAHVERLTVSVISDHDLRRSARASRIRNQADRHRQEVVASYLPLLPVIRSGAAVDALGEFAKPYFLIDRTDETMSGRERIAAQSSAVIADAAIEGFEALALRAPPFAARELGIAEGKGESYAWEVAALAGVDLLLAREPARLDAASPVLALIVLRQAGFVQDDGRRDEITDWAYRLLDRDPSQGAAAIFEQWEGMRSTRKGRSSTLWPLAQIARSGPAMTLAIERMLEAHPDLSFDPPQMLLVGASERLAPVTLERLARAALAREKLPGPARAQWSIILFALRGDVERDRLKGHRAQTMQELLEAHSWAMACSRSCQVRMAPTGQRGRPRSFAP